MTGANGIDVEIVLRELPRGEPGKRDDAWPHGFAPRNAASAAPSGYRRHRPEDTVLHGVDHLGSRQAVESSLNHARLSTIGSAR